jgi:HAD superfamily phosphoserine phosphatase-like hydrolase
MAPCRGLVIFDLDGTLLRGQTVCELFADALDRSVEMQAFERLSGEHEIALARVEMANWYRESSRSSLLACLESARWAPGAVEGLASLREAGVAVGIASITWRFAVEWFAHRLGVAHVLATGLDEHGLIDHVWPRDKATWLHELATQYEVAPDRTAAVGDSAGDLPMLRCAGLRFYVGAERPAEFEGVHMPSGDIGEIARRILEEWAP